jgi:L-seryl-tRNA(Ser) seleniumtransferase
LTLRDLPSVHELVRQLDSALPHERLVALARTVLHEARAAILQSETPVETPLAKAARIASALRTPSQRRVINATGVVLHTNLGRAPLAELPTTSGYSNLEYDLVTGKRGKRDVHAGRLLEALLGRPAISVNNNAGALFLILNELAAGGETVISRGELIEIGDGFRIPEIMRRSGTELREVGTTNRTRIEDYRDAITDRTRVLLRVHPSNFRMTGFTSRPELAELVELGRERGIPVYEDLGSGCLVDLREFGIPEPTVQDNLAAGANLVSCSGDKLLGASQSGIIAGDADLVNRVRRNPLFRAFRQDKLALHALETTLRHLVLGELDRIPALRMMRITPDQLRLRAESLAARIPGATVEQGESVIGGGSTPDLSLPTWLVVLPANEKAVTLERRLRSNSIPIIARIEQDRVVLDPRTLFPEDGETVVAALDYSPARCA